MADPSVKQNASPAPVAAPPAAEAAPPEKMVRVKLLKAYWPADGRLNETPDRKAAHARRFDPGDIIELPASEALKCINPMEIPIREIWVDRIDEQGRKYKQPVIRPPIAVRADAYTV